MTRRLRLIINYGTLVAAGIAATAAIVSVMRAAGPHAATVTVSGQQEGVSEAYIGANEGDQYFNINDLTDLGINTYRIYGGMSRWEWQDDDGNFGSPTIAQIEANPNVINWAWWDSAMNATAATQNGSDYWWSSDPTVWKGSAVTIFSTLQAHNIRPVVVLRNVDNNDNPSWAYTQLDPPNTTAGQNEWWEHVFATVYWLNVRNNYNVNDWEVHNEPNNDGQGWEGTEADYFNFVQLTKNAIDYVYQTYLPGRTYHVYAPVTTGGSSWPNDALLQVGTYFDSMDVHNYSGNIDGYDETVHGYMNADGYPSDPLWLTEWSTYRGQYNSVSFDVSNVIGNLMNGSAPGSDYVTGSHIFSLYDWGTYTSGLIGPGDVPRAGYYAMRLAIRGLQGGRPTFASTSDNSNIQAITTKDSSGHVYVLLTNTSHGAITTTIDLSALLTSGTGTMWEFDSSHNDVVVGNPTLANGMVTVTLDAVSGNLIEF
jgi:hypothetical protein